MIGTKAKKKYTPLTGIFSAPVSDDRYKSKKNHTPLTGNFSALVRDVLMTFFLEHLRTELTLPSDCCLVLTSE